MAAAQDGHHSNVITPGAAEQPYQPLPIDPSCIKAEIASNSVSVSQTSSIPFSRYNNGSEANTASTGPQNRENVTSEIQQNSHRQQNLDQRTPIFDHQTQLNISGDCLDRNLIQPPNNGINLDQQQHRKSMEQQIVSMIGKPNLDHNMKIMDQQTKSTDHIHVPEHHIRLEQNIKMEIDPSNTTLDNPVNPPNVTHYRSLDHQSSLEHQSSLDHQNPLDHRTMDQHGYTEQPRILDMDTQYMVPSSSTMEHPEMGQFNLYPMSEGCDGGDLRLVGERHTIDPDPDDMTSPEHTVQPADSNSSKQSFVPCKVCGDRASGYHYGVTSCEGCKGFFRRSIQKQIEYRCLRDGKCLVIRLNRNRCQYCRFKKCLAVGMSRDSVRYGRVPKKAKLQELEKTSQSAESCIEQAAMETKRLAIYDVILNISQAHHANCALTEDKIKDLKRLPIQLMQLDHSGNSITAETLDHQRLKMWENLALLITPSIQSVVEFAKRVPGFAELSQDDQLILIKAGFFEIWLVRLARMICPGENLITFEDGSMVHQDELCIVYTPVFVASIFSVAAGFNMLHLNDTEIGLFAGVVLATADRSDLTDTKAIEAIQDRLLEALKLQVSRNHSTEEHLFASALMKLPELRTLGNQHAQLLPWLRGRWNAAKLPPLFSEIYDIPKVEEIETESAAPSTSPTSQ